MFKIFKRNKNIIIVLILFFIICTCTIAKANGSPKPNSNNNFNTAQTNNHTENVHGKVVKIYLSNTKKDTNNEEYNNIDVKILSGKFKGQLITTQNYFNEKANDEKNNIQSLIRVGDEVLISIDEDPKGNIANAYIYDMVRYKYLYELVAVFMLLIIIVGGIKGLKSIITLGITGVAVIKIFIPLVLKGYNPITISIIICIFVIVLNLLLIGGMNKKTLAAIIGTSGGVLTAGIIAIFSNYILRINGLTDDEVQTVIYTTQNANFNFRGLLFAGIIMGALGAVMDVSMSIASAIKEIKEARPDISRKELLKSGMNVGKDIMGTMANTLILAYTGGAMYVMLMMVSYTTIISEIVNQDVVAAEILKALAGSIGLVVTIPITAIVASTLIVSSYEKYD